MNIRHAIGAALVLVVLVRSGVASAALCSDGSPAPPPRPADTGPPPTLDETCIERNIFLMPGAFATYFQPNARLGPFFGGGVQLAPFQWSHNNDRFGPSQGGIFMQAALLESQTTGGVLALFDVGATASFERNASRRWLIPYYGGAAGGLAQATLGKSGYVYPFAGLHVFWHRDLMVDAEGGYHFPFEDIDRARGPRAQLTARFSLW
jgi:hypothetical protein